MIDYANMAKKATQATEKDSIAFDEGDSLVLLVPVEPIEVTVYQGKVNDLFKRSIVNYDQKFCQREDYQKALGFPLPDGDPVADWARDNLNADDFGKARPKPITIWGVCVLGHRRPKAKPGTGFENIYTKPKWMTAKEGSHAKPHIQAGLNMLMAGGGPELVQRMFSMDEAQLVVISRVGRGQYDTTFSVKLAEGTDPEFGDLSAYAVPADIRQDVADATAPGGNLDLVNMIATKFSPSPDEMAKRFAGEGGGAGNGPGMDE